MSHAVSLQIPCLGASKPYYSGDRGRSALFDTKTKVVSVVSTFLAITGLALLQSFPPVGGACIAAAGLGFLYIFLFKLIEAIRTPDSDLEKIERLPAAKRLAAGIEIPPALQQELVQVIPAIDAIEENDRVASVRYNYDETATFTLKTAPDLQFRVSAAASRSRLGCQEMRLARRYENIVYAQEICRSENYDSLFVPPIKPIHFKVGGLRRSVLVEKVVQRDASPDQNLERAVRQMVQFLLKTGGTHTNYDPLPFVPVKGNKLTLQNLHQLTENPHPDLGTREYLEVKLIIDKENSLLASLDREDLIDIALDELLKLRPIHQTMAQYDLGRAAEKRREEIQKAKEERLNQIRNPPQIGVLPARINPPNILRISPEDLGLNLAAKDYAVIKSYGAHSDGICRPITLGEVAQAILDRINQKLQANPTHADIEFTPEDMLIGEKLPSFSWKQHYQYNMLQGLGYREWPDPNQEPPYWMGLVLQSLKAKGLIADFTLTQGAKPRLRVNLAALGHN